MNKIVKVFQYEGYRIEMQLWHAKYISYWAFLDTGYLIGSSKNKHLIEKRVKKYLKERGL